VLRQGCRQPRTEGDECGKTLGFRQGQRRGNDPALTEAEDDQLVSGDGIALEGRIEEKPGVVHSCGKGGWIGRASHGNRKPAIPRHRAQRHLRRSLGAQHQESTAGQIRCQTEQIHGVGTPTVQRDDRRMRSLARWLVCCVQQMHHFAVAAPRLRERDTGCQERGGGSDTVVIDRRARYFQVVRKMRGREMRVLALVLVGLAASVAGCMGTTSPRKEAIAVAPLPTPAPERWILVRKTERTLSLYDGSEVRKVYPVVLGKDPVPAKLYQGDHRTPEGEYHIVKKYYHPFWSRFLMLDYPTPRNEELYAWSRERGLLPGLGRSVRGIGGAVGIHGTEDERLNRSGKDWTEGCVSLFNRDIDELYDLVPVGTRVVIEH